MAGWKGKGSLPPGKKATTCSDVRIRDLQYGNAFSWFTFYTVQTGKTKKFLLRRPDGKYSVLIGIYAVSDGPASLEVTGGITVEEEGVTPYPAPSNRNSDPLYYRPPWFQITEDADWSGGLLVLKQRIDYNLRTIPDSFEDRANIANIAGGATAGIQIKNLAAVDITFNIAISWSERIN